MTMMRVPHELDESAKANLKNPWDYEEYEKLRDRGYDYDELAGFIWSCLEETPDNEINSTDAP